MSDVGALPAEARAAGVTLSARVWAEPAEALPRDLRDRLRKAERDILLHLLGMAEEPAAPDGILAELGPAGMVFAAPAGAG